MQVWFSNRRARSKKLTIPTQDETNTIPAFPTSPITDTKPYSMSDNIFDPTITSSPSTSMFNIDWLL
jgi:hypothetical protein